MIDIFIGTYEGLLVRLQGNPEKLNTIWSYNCSQHHLRSLTHSGRYLAAAGYDEQIHVIDTIKNKELIVLEGHVGTVNKVLFC